MLKVLYALPLLFCTSVVAGNEFLPSKAELKDFQEFNSKLVSAIEQNDHAYIIQHLPVLAPLGGDASGIDLKKLSLISSSLLNKGLKRAVLDPKKITLCEAYLDGEGYVLQKVFLGNEPGKNPFEIVFIRREDKWYFGENAPSTFKFFATWAPAKSSKKRKKSKPPKCLYKFKVSTT